MVGIVALKEAGKGKRESKRCLWQAEAVKEGDTEMRRAR